MQLQLDKELWLGIPIFTLGAAVSLGLVSSTLFGYDLSQIVLETNGIGFSVARLLSVSALALVVLNREQGLQSIRSFVGVEAWAVYVTIGLILAPPFLPLLEGTLLEQPWAIMAFLAQTMGITIISYLN